MMACFTSDSYVKVACRPNSTSGDSYPGFPHAFHAGFPQLTASRKCAGIQWLFSAP
ncbi:hypothetical protein DFH09DRAFT_1045553 [Mycena vulgaris]|nr:hypothetical protein DFH09DRAFT_1045553 [Mycena vulgaris]